MGGLCLAVGSADRMPEGEAAAAEAEAPGGAFVEGDKRGAGIHHAGDGLTVDAETGVEMPPSVGAKDGTSWNGSRRFDRLVRCCGTRIEIRQADESWHL